jgi:hypothetical protein
VTILRVPAAGVIDDDPVATFPTGNSQRIIGVTTQVIPHAIAHTLDHSRCACHHWHSLFHRDRIAKRDINPIMTVGDARFALKIARTIGRIHINIISNPARVTELALNGSAQLEGVGSFT